MVRRFAMPARSDKSTDAADAALGLIHKALPNSGPEGFEGLVGALLGRLTGHEFRLSASGSQAGRDLTATTRRGTVICVEAKRYANDTALNERELLGEMVQASRDQPDLDLWVLVASRAVPQQLHQALARQAEATGIEFAAICTCDGLPSSLHALLATDVALVLSFVRQAGQANEAEIAELEAALERVRVAPGLDGRLAGLRDTFGEARLGYDHWCRRQADGLQRSFSSAERSRDVYGQVIAVSAPRGPAIPRRAVAESLDAWWDSWPGAPTLQVVRGEEGDGKTWAVAGWLTSRPPHLPAVWVNAHSVETQDPSELLADAVSRAFATPDAPRWRRKFDRWARARSTTAPSVLLVLDGINERRSWDWWRGLLDRLVSEPWRESIATVVTCRTDYWKQYLKPLGHLPTSLTEVGSYSDRELGLALESEGVAASDFSDELLPLLRKPRYLAMAVRHHSKVTEAGEFTVQRLIYEDAKDRYERKRGVVDERTFQEVLVGLARRRRNRDAAGSGLTPLGATSPISPEVLSDLSTSGVLTRRGGRLGIDDRRLGLALGLLLAEDCLEAQLADGESAAQFALGWLEPEPGIPLKAEICEIAALHALTSEDFTDEAASGLLDAWARLQNAPGREEHFPAYFPRRPTAYFALAERSWAASEFLPDHHRLLVTAFLEWRGNATLRPLFVSTFQRWLGFVHPAGERALMGGEAHEIEKARARIAGRLGTTLSPGPLSICGLPLEVIEAPGLLRLARVALGVISHLPREDFARALAVGALADEVMGGPRHYQEFAWLIRSSPTPFLPSLLPHVELLTSEGSAVAVRTARRLLTYVGSEESRSLRAPLAELFPDESFRWDPCDRLPWRREDCEKCSELADQEPWRAATAIAPSACDPSLRVSPRLVEALDRLAADWPREERWTGSSMTAEEGLLEDAEPTFCAFRPQALAPAIRRMALHAERRAGTGLRSLLWGLRGHELILGAAEWASLRVALKTLHDRFPTSDRVEQQVESEILSMLLQASEPDEQLELLAQRPSDAPDRVAFERTFDRPPRREVVSQVLAGGSASAIRRVLWLLACTSARSGPTEIDGIATLWQHDDMLVRACVLNLIRQHPSDEWVRSVVDGGWTAGAAAGPVEAYWGSRLLIERATWLSVDALKDRVSRSTYADLVEARGGADDYLEFARWFERELEPHSSLPVTIEIGRDEVCAPPGLPRPRVLPKDESTPVLRSRTGAWGDARAATVEDWKRAFDLSGRWEEASRRLEQAQDAGSAERERNLGLIDSPSRRVLERILACSPELRDRWVSIAFDDAPSARQRVEDQPGFFQDLCAVLLASDPGLGARLFSRLEKTSRHLVVDSATGISSLKLALWAAPESSELDDLRLEHIRAARSDLQHSRIAFAAEWGGAVGALMRLLEGLQAAPRALDQARAIVVRSFLSSAATPNLLGLQDGTFLGEVARFSEAWTKSDAFAQHWYRRYREAESDELAWAAFRLLLRCVDKRFWLWRVSIDRAAPTSERRERFLRAQRNEIVRAVKDNEKSLEDTLVGVKVLDSSLWPWMGWPEVADQS